MNKKGFTLIELMVVVVIIGILAAVAVPKLFGMIAKSKASEVGPAAGTYTKMQQAFISEAMMIGDWIIIGYKGPGTVAATKLASETNTFNYSDNGSYTANSVAIGAALTGFMAKNKAKLNDCAKDGEWTVKISGTAGASEGTFVSAANSDDCRILTPTFNTIGN